MEIRKIVVTMEETLIEGFKVADKPVKVAVAAAVIKTHMQEDLCKSFNP